MKRLLAILLATFMVMGLAVGCGGEPGGANNSGDNNGPNPNGGETPTRDLGNLNVWSFTDEIPNAIKRYQEMNPNSIVSRFEIAVTQHTDWSGDYENAIEPALEQGGANAPDLYMVEQAFVIKFTQGSFAEYAATYTELGIENVGTKIADAQLAEYAVRAGTRPADNQVVGLRFQETGACTIYRRSIAKDVWDNDDPEFVAGKVGPGWQKFIDAAGEMRDAGYAMVHGDEDLWQAARDSAVQPWIVDNKLVIDPARMIYFDIAKTFFEGNDNGRFIVGDGAWNESWRAGMAGRTDPQIFCYLGPAWLINYTILASALGTDDEDFEHFGSVNPSWEDWAVTTSPVPWAWGGTWLLGNKNLDGDKRTAVAEIIEWITLDTSETGFQHHFANGTLYKDSKLFPNEAKQVEDGTAGKDAVASKVVMDRSKGELKVTAGQDIFPYFLAAGRNARADHWTELDRGINGRFQEECRAYYNGQKTREEALNDFKQWVKDTHNVDVD
jgi:hypothetical protein